MTSILGRFSTLKFVPAVVGLLLFGILFENVGHWSALRTPRPIYFQTSYTLALLQQVPLASLVGLVALALAGWLLLPRNRGRLSWREIDSVGGLRWPVFVAALSLAWNYAGYPYNYFFDQAHLWDRWLLILLLFATLRSPLLIPFFVAEVLVSRIQFTHPINSLTTIPDELPIRVLGIVLGCALWNGLIDGLLHLQSKGRLRLKENVALALRISTHSLVYAILCLVSFYYVNAGVSKALLGETPVDWMRFGHMENLYVASYLNGWLNHMSEARVLEIAHSVRMLSLPIAIATMAIEVGMILVLMRPRITLLLLASVSGMHLGIVAMSGIFFWQWMMFDFALLAWLWRWRADSGVGRLYSRSRFVASLLIIAALTAGFRRNDLAWWNTKWIMLNEIEVLDASGEVYLVDFADFSPYSLVDLYKPERRRMGNTAVYGMSFSQPMLQVFEEGDPRKLRFYLESGAEAGDGPIARRHERAFAGFMRGYFRSRNKAGGRTVAPFVFGVPAKNNRHLSAPNLYRDQAPVVEARLRFIEIHYTGTELTRMRDEIVYSIPIPSDAAAVPSPSAK